MTTVSVITGGAGGMGLATARILGRDHAVVLCDVRQDRLDAAAATLTDLGITATAINCDVTDQQSVTRLLDTAIGLGTLASVIHTAGVSPSMGDSDHVMKINAIGTLNVNVASMAAYLLPESLIPVAQFPLALEDSDAFLAEMASVCSIAPDDARSGMAYAVSKSFVRWYSSAQAERFNGRGLRIVSVSPGSVDTEMGRLEEQAGAGAMVTDAAVPRWGLAEEMAELFAFCASSKAGYLTGTDILNDGGVVASVRERARVAAESG
jgi:NAD(P)-dependent dehydrogenase (short-subunit alcohol dehydrogenase family)